MSRYFIYNVLGNKQLMDQLVTDEVQGNSLEVIGEKKQRGYNGMISNLSNNLMDILGLYENPNKGLEEIQSIYANVMGQLQALGTNLEEEPEKIEEQIIEINRNVNRQRQEYYGKDGYRRVNVGLGKKDVGFVDFQNVPQAMKLYAQQCGKLVENADNMSKGEYIKQVAKMHLRFIRIHPFPDGNGRTARAITNMFLAKKGECAVFDKRTKGNYGSFIEMINNEDVAKYKQALSSDVATCDQIEDKVVYKLEEYLGIELLGEKDLYKDRDITAPLPIQKEADNER